MERKFDTNRLGNRWIDRIVWHVAATAALAGMIAVLLGSLKWLDEIDPAAAHNSVRFEPRARLEVPVEPESEPRTRRLVGVRGPSG